NYERRSRYECPGNRHSLLLTTAKLSRSFICHTFKAYSLQHLSRSSSPYRFREPAGDEWHFDVFACGESTDEVEGLVNESYPSVPEKCKLVLVKFLQIYTIDQYTT